MTGVGPEFLRVDEGQWQLSRAPAGPHRAGAWSSKRWGEAQKLLSLGNSFQIYGISWIKLTLNRSRPNLIRGKRAIERLERMPILNAKLARSRARMLDPSRLAGRSQKSHSGGPRMPATG